MPQIWKQPRRPSLGERINVAHLYNKCYSVLKRNVLWSCEKSLGTLSAWYWKKSKSVYPTLLSDSPAWCSRKQYCGASAKVSGYQGSMTEQCTKPSQGSDIFCMIYHGGSMSLNVCPSPKSMEFYVDVMLMVGKAAFGCLEHCRSNSAFLCTWNCSKIKFIYRYIYTYIYI